MLALAALATDEGLESCLELLPALLGRVKQLKSQMNEQAVSNVMLAVAKLHSKGVGIQSLAGFLTVLEQRIEDVTPYMTAEGVSNMMGVMATLSADAAAFKASVDSLPVLHFRMSQVKSQMKVSYIYRVACATLQLHRLGAESKVLAPVLTSLDSRLLEVVPKLNARGVSSIMGVVAICSTDYPPEFSADVLRSLSTRIKEVEAELTARDVAELMRAVGTLSLDAFQVCSGLLPVLLLRLKELEVEMSVHERVDDAMWATARLSQNLQADLAAFTRVNAEVSELSGVEASKAMWVVAKLYAAGGPTAPYADVIPLLVERIKEGQDDIKHPQESQSAGLCQTHTVQLVSFACEVTSRPCQDTEAQAPFGRATVQLHWKPAAFGKVLRYTKWSSMQVAQWRGSYSWFHPWRLSFAHMARRRERS
ncbi:unnamed protein product [Effrenium voratum]|nr:unnamed protein product [Effrenium voratum]